MQRYRRLSLAFLVAACGALTVSPAGAAGTADDDIAIEDIPISSLAGSYLAGRSADTAHDLQAAAHFYGAALAADPDNPLLMERVVMLNLAIGDMDQAFDYATSAALSAQGSPIAQIALAVKSLADGAYDEVPARFAGLPDAPLATLTSGLVTAWAEFGAGDLDKALATVDALKGPSWYDIFKSYHSALLLDAGGRTGEALDRIATAYDSDDSALRIVDAYARIAARAGLRNEATEAVTKFAGLQPLHPVAKSLLAELRSGVTPAPIAADARAGAAEVLYGLGSAIGGDDGPELPAAYLRLAAYLDPDNGLATMAIGDVLQDADRCEEAIAVYDTIPEDAPLRRNADIQMGSCLRTLDRLDEAATIIGKVVEADPADFEAAIELGNVHRANDDYAKAADAYTQGIDALPAEAEGAWRIFYFRGIAYERSKQWPKAEADFLHALELVPDQPQVLNYLGYSWVDMGMNLDRALGMIRTAVDLRPNDGYIVDSLGWAYYRLDRFEDAVVELEKAVELRPEDPTINDHLGDAFWKVGRKREAMFQWAHARDLEPDSADVDLNVILAKLERGLDAIDSQPEVTSAEATPADTTPAEEAPAGTVVASAGGTPAASALPKTLLVGDGDSLWTIAEKLYGDGNAYVRLLESNAALIKDPDLIYPGMTLNIPPAEGQ